MQNVIAFVISLDVFILLLQCPTVIMTMFKTQKDVIKLNAISFKFKHLFCFNLTAKMQANHNAK